MRAIARLAFALPLVVFGLADCNCDDVVAGTAPEIGIFDDQGNVHSEADPWLVVPFGDIDTGQENTRVLQVKNVGFGALRIDSVCIVNAPDLASAIEPSAPCVQQGASSFVFPSIVGTELRADAAVDLPVTFQPVSGGPTSVFLRVGSDAVGEPLAAVQLTGRGTDGSLCADPAVVDFGSVAVGASKTLPVVVSNCGVKPVTIDALLLAANPDSAFAFDVGGTAPTLPLAPLAEGASITLNVTFSPARAVPYRDANAGNLRATTAAPFAATYDLILLGTGIEPPSCRINVVPSTVNFGAVASGASADRQVIVQSVGQCACSVTAITDPSPSTAGFVLPTPAALPVVLKGTTGCETDPPQAAQAPQSLSIPVRYTAPQRQNPTADRATMTVTTDAPVDGTREIALEASGGGTPFCQLRVTPQGTGSLLPTPPNQRWGIVQFGRTSINIEKKLPITLENVGNTACTISRVAYDKEENTLFNEFRLEDENGANAITNASTTVQPGQVKTYFGVFAPTRTIDSENPLDLFSFGSYSGALSSTSIGCGGLFGSDPNTRCNGVKFVTNDTTTDVSASEQQAGTFSIGFAGTPVEPSVDIIPPELDFGLVTLDCGSPERRTTVYNTGATDLVVNQPYVDPSSTPAVFTVVSTSNPGDSPSNTTSGWPYTIAPGNSLSIAVRYFARAEGLQTALLMLPTVENNQEGPPVTVPLRGEGTLISSQTDVFDQAREATVDVLFVVDDSGSMADEQALLASNFAQFFTASNVDDADYHIAVTTTLTASSSCIPSPISPTCGDDDMSGYYTSCSGERYLTTSSSDPQGQFACNVRVSDRRNPSRDTSDSAEGGLRAAYNFLSAPKINDPAINGGFLRDNAKLHVIMVSDEADQSRGPTDLYVDFFRNVKGFRNESLVAVSAIAKSDGEACTTDDYEGDERYESVVDTLNGRFQSICDQNWSQMMRNLGLDSVGLQVEFFLSRAATESSLSVCVRNGSSTAPCQPATETSEGAQNGWFYDAAANSIVFNAGSVPARGSRVEVRYDAFCFQP